ncbi:MAG: hypothetical protein GY714_23165 [Desulfobacterales bacterium]|nr:hypothetical protein [Desulfobacterales bacterium]
MIDKSFDLANPMLFFDYWTNRELQFDEDDDVVMNMVKETPVCEKNEKDKYTQAYVEFIDYVTRVRMVAIKIVVFRAVVIGYTCSEISGFTAEKCRRVINSLTTMGMATTVRLIHACDYATDILVMMLSRDHMFHESNRFVLDDIFRNLWSTRKINRSGRDDPVLNYHYRMQEFKYHVDHIEKHGTELSKKVTVCSIFIIFIH